MGIAVPAAIGHLHLLWWWAIEYAEDGDLSGFDAEELAAVCQWPGEAATLSAALERAGFLNADGRLHDWDDYSGRLQEQRERMREHSKERMRRYRARRATTEGAVAPPVAPPLRVTNALHAASRDAQLRNTVPDLTGPNLTTNASALDPASAVPHANEPMAVDVVAPVEIVTSASALAPLLVADEPVEPAAPAPKPRAPLAPAVQVVRTILGFTPDDRQKREIIAAVGEAEDGVALWRRCCVAWKDAGYKPRNLAGILDWYADGGPPPRYAEHAAPGERRAGRAPGPLSSSANGRPLVGAAALFAMSPLSRPPPSEGEFLAEPRQHRRSAP